MVLIKVMVEVNPELLIKDCNIQEKNLPKVRKYLEKLIKGTYWDQMQLRLMVIAYEDGLNDQ